MSTDAGIEPGTACALCDADDVLGVGLCPSCLASDGAERSLVFVQSPRAERHGTGGALLDLVLDGSDLASARAGLRSGRPLYGVPADVATRVVAALEAMGIGARSVPAARAWQGLPSRFYIMLAFMVGVGALAGFMTEPSFLWMSPVLALSLLFVALRSVQRPVVAVDGAGGWSSALHAEIAGTLIALPPGTPRDRLIDLARIARPLAMPLTEHGDPARISDAVNNLLRAACGTARESDRLGRSADVIRSSLVWTPEVAGEEQAEAARAVLLRCSELAGHGTAELTAAVTALGRIDAEAAGLDGPVISELQERTRGLEAAARIHAETLDELNELLG